MATVGSKHKLGISLRSGGAQNFRKIFKWGSLKAMLVRNSAVSPTTDLCDDGKMVKNVENGQKLKKKKR